MIPTNWRSVCFSMGLLIYIGVMTADVPGSTSPYRWMQRDNFDEVMELMDKVNIENCASLPATKLRLPASTVGQQPRFNNIPLNRWYKNRTSLLYMHSLALNRAHYFSYILQRLNTSKVDYPLLPGFLYYYFSTTADVTSGYGSINGSAVLMNTNCTYANWLTDLDFNRTLPLFGPKAMRLDDWMDENNWLREPTNHTIQVDDFGAGPNSNYTAAWYRTNPYWTETKFFPDTVNDITTKHQYDTQIEYSTIDGVPIKPVPTGYFGPTSPGTSESILPVRFTAPYFDCGKTNKWIFAAVAPVVDYMVRYSNQTRLRNGQIVGLITMEMDFLRLDFNPCPLSDGNEYHYFVNTARCKYSTTQCEPLPGFGYRRGGYQCHCRPGYRLPFTQNGPFQGVDIEKATKEEYENGFDCLPINWQEVLPIDNTIERNLERKRRSTEGDDTSSSVLKFVAGAYNSLASFLTSDTKRLTSARIHHNSEEMDENPTPKLAARIPITDPTPTPASSRTKLVSRRRRALEYFGKNSAFDAAQYQKVQKLLIDKRRVKPENCAEKSYDELNFPGEVGYGADVRFEMQARTALRLSHFLSAFFQNHIKGEIYGNLNVDQPLNQHHLFGEAIANVVGDRLIVASGIFFDSHKWVDDKGVKWRRFGPLAYTPLDTTQTFRAQDMGSKKYSDYLTKPWFQFLKERWASNTYGLERVVNKPWKRQDINGTMLERFDNYPLYFRAPKLDDGYWTQPYYDCEGPRKDWLMTYAVPFFGLPRQDSPLQFMGVVTVSVPLDQLDINQCPASFYTANFFKNTARCDYRTSYCVPWDRRGFDSGSYRCECRQGFEHPTQDMNWYYEGQTMEIEYNKKLMGEKNRYDTLRCRQADGFVHKASAFLCIVSVLFSMLY